MIKDAIKIKEKGLNEYAIGKQTLFYIRKKLVNLYPYIFLTFILNNIFYFCFYSNQGRIVNLGEEAEKQLWDILLLSQFGIGGNSNITGHMWYISAMIIMMLVLYSVILADNKDVFPYVYAPIVALYGYTYLKLRYNSVQADTVLAFSDTGLLIHPNLIRAMAGLSSGCIIYKISKSISRHIEKVTFKAKFVLKSIEVVFIGLCLLIMQLKAFTKWDFIVILLLFCVLCIAFGYNLKPNKWEKYIIYLGKISIPIYFFQNSAVYLINTLVDFGLQSVYIRFAVFWGWLIGISSLSVFIIEKFKR